MTDNNELLEFLYLTPIGVAKSDKDGNIILMNPVLNNLLMQLQNEDCFSSENTMQDETCYVNKIINILDYLTIFDKNFKQIVTSRISQKQTEILRHYDIHIPNRPIQYIRLCCSRLTNDDLFFTIENITELKKTEIDLVNSREDLKKSNAMKDKLFSIVAHDLRGPIGALATALEMMVQEPGSFDQEEMTEMLEILQKSSQSTYSLLENLLYWARNQMGDITYNPENLVLNQIILEKMNLYTLLAKEKKIEIVTELKKNKINCYADKNMLETILRNLISNAIKFTPQNGKISLSVLQNKNKITVQIKDTGIGMNNEQLKNIFDYTSYSSTRGTAGEKGTGLGLLLCKDFVEQNKGTFKITSQEGNGTTISFTLPISQA